MVFYPLQELERGRITFGLLRVENRVFIEIITLCVRRWVVRDSSARLFACCRGESSHYTYH